VLFTQDIRFKAMAESKVADFCMKG
jgi:hypothetical protein